MEARTFMQKNIKNELNHYQSKLLHRVSNAILSWTPLVQAKRRVLIFCILGNEGKKERVSTINDNKIKQFVKHKMI